MNVNTFDLNLLRVFDAVMREGNITAAGARLGLTQPAMSHALKRLRNLCNDPLFVRTTRGMKPTAHAQQLAEPLVCLMRRDHPVIGKKLSLGQFLDTGQISVSAPAQVDRLIKRALGKHAARRRIVLHVPHYLVVPMILAQSDLVAIMPATVAAIFSAVSPLKALPAPFRVAPVHVRQFWHARSHHDPGHRWLRGMIAELFAQPGKRA